MSRTTEAIMLMVHDFNLCKSSLKLSSISLEQLNVVQERTEPHLNLKTVVQAGYKYLCYSANPK
jgi:hypothetical protein